LLNSHRYFDHDCFPKFWSKTQGSSKAAAEGSNLHQGTCSSYWQGQMQGHGRPQGGQGARAST